jgi:hypothetical protein
MSTADWQTAATITARQVYKTSGLEESSRARQAKFLQLDGLAIFALRAVLRPTKTIIMQDTTRHA